MPRYRYPALPESEITPESLYRSRRRFMKQAGSLALAASLPGWAGSAAASAPQRPWHPALAEAPTSPFSTDESLTEKRIITSYNNFFEFGSRKRDPSDWAHYLQTDPWAIKVEGEVNKPGTYDLDDLVRAEDLEERIYRLRCVEAWSMVVPWVGFELRKLIERLEPTSRAKYVVFETLYDPQQFRGQRRRSTIDWPYTEGLRMDEAMHPLTLLAVGLYGKPMPNQNGAPIRLVVPWKYGFKSIKSIVTLRFQEQQPVSTWEQMAPDEYGFYANVNPNVSHPRWSQARERRLGEDGRRETLMFNGYADEVAQLYQGMDLERYF